MQRGTGLNLFNDRDINWHGTFGVYGRIGHLPEGQVEIWNDTHEANRIIIHTHNTDRRKPQGVSDIPIPIPIPSSLFVPRPYK